MQISTATSATSAFGAMSGAFGSQNPDPQKMGEMDTKLATDIMSAKDADKSGTLSASELGVSQDQVSEFDTDGDGVVSSAELTAGLKAQREKMQAQMQNQMQQSGQLGMLQASMGQGSQGAQGGDPSQMAAQMAQNIIAQKDADKSGGLSASELGVSADQLKKVDTNGDGVVSQDELTAALKANQENGGAGKTHHHHHHKAAASQTDQTGQADQSSDGVPSLDNLISGLFGNNSSTKTSGTTGTSGSASSDGSSLTGSLSDFMLRQKATSAYQNVDKIISSLFGDAAQTGQTTQSVSVSA